MQTPIVIHNESGYIRAGLSSDDTPSVVFPTDSVTGTSPLARNIVTDWDGMTKVWSHVYEQLGVDPTHHPVLLSEVPLNLKHHRETVTSLFFETFGVPAFFIAQDAVLALYASDKTTGIVLEIGEGITHTVPIYEGYALPHAILRLDLAGQDLDGYLVKLLGEGGYTLSETTDRADLEKIRAELGYVALDFEGEMQQSTSSLTKTFTTANGQTITLGNGRFRVSEALFQPAFLGMEQTGIHECVYNSIMKCDVDIRKTMYANTVVVGSSSIIPGICERLHKEIMALAPTTMKIQIEQPAEPENAIWRGGDKLAPLLAEYGSWISKEEYAQYGATIVHRKCF